ncbi:hypothetical protein D3C71_2015750 [compost metagenome]
MQLASALGRLAQLGLGGPGARQFVRVMATDQPAIRLFDLIVFGVGFHAQQTQ